MNEASPFSDPVNDPIPGSGRLPGSINTLTILTFIGSGLLFLLSIYGFIMVEKQYEQTSELLNSGKIDELPAFMRNMITPESLELMRKQADNKVPMLIVGLVGLGLCVYGAIQMRNLLKQGYYLWLLGVIVPTITSVIILGPLSVVNGIMSYIFIAIEVIFAVLYATQLKYMK